MSLYGDRCTELVRQMELAANDAVRAMTTMLSEGELPSSSIDCMKSLQEEYERDFPHLTDEVEYWDALWVQTEEIRRHWARIAAAAARSGAANGEKLTAFLNDRRRELYQWARRHICDHAPRAPSAAHFELGIDVRRPDFRGLHQRLEGLAESIRCQGCFPEVRERKFLTGEHLNYAIIYGCGWNESAFSVLCEAWRFKRMNAFVTFDYPGPMLYDEVGRYTVRLGRSGLLRADDEDNYVLATFEEPVILHFVCPHQWSGPSPCELGLPVLRSDLALAIVDDKLNTTRALVQYAEEHGVDVPLIREEGIGQACIPADMEELSMRADESLGRLLAEDVAEVVIKPVRGEQKQGLAYFELPEKRAEAAAHAAQLALESGAVIQERIRPPGSEDFNWRVTVALAPNCGPHVVGRFARVGNADVTAKARDRDILAQCGITDDKADAFLDRLDAVSLDAFRAVVAYAEKLYPDFPCCPLGGGSYYVPYLLGIDLIGDALVMEVNGNEVGGMWVDDRLYPETAGRTNHTMLQSAEIAARAYKRVLELDL